MDGFRVFILAMQSAMSLTLIALALPLALRMVAPNHWYGFRMPRTLADSDTWYEANAFAGRCLAFVGTAIGSVSLALYFVPRLDGPTYAMACVGVSLLAVSAGVAASVWHLRTLPR